MSIRDWFSIRKAGGGVADFSEPGRQPLFLEYKNLTFPGVVVVAGTIVNFAASGAPELKLGIAALIAIIFGGFMIWIGLTDKENAERKPIQAFVGLVNTALLWITIYGMANLPAP
jgi:hypothetical protein